jgi:hypothetical protein
MDVSTNLGAPNPIVAYPHNLPLIPAAAQAAASLARLTPGASDATPARVSAAVADAPSPTPENELAESQHLPAAIQYAPSPAPGAAQHSGKFDRSA